MPPVILVVEDEPILRQLTAEALEQVAAGVIDCANADEALAILKQTPGISLVVTDINMPGSLDGLALAREIWAHWPTIAVVLTSGQAAALLGGLPINGRFLQKPWLVDELLQTAEDLLRNCE